MNEEEKPRPNYYSVVPAPIRYDSLLTPNAKLLYGEITALCNAHGYCWASNRYFADLYKVETRTVRMWISALAKRKHIIIELIRDSRGMVTERRLYITDTGTLGKIIS